MIFSIFRRKSTATLSRERLSEVYQTMAAMVLRRCRMILRDESRADDAMQETFVRLATYGAEFEQRAVPLSWMYRTAERVCFEMIGKGKREPIAEGTFEPEDLPAEGGFGASESVEIIHQFLRKMDLKSVQVALLYYVDGLSQEAIAAELNWSRRTVGKKIALLRERAERLKQRIENV